MTERGLCGHRFEIVVPGEGAGCGERPVLVSGDTTLEYFTEPADPDCDYSSRTYDVWVGDDLELTSVTCPDCDRVLPVSREDLAALGARAAIALLTDHYADLQYAAKEDYEG
jgi:hypothetical protein